jgi:peptide/nickel transport system substrate-binding protein
MLDAQVTSGKLPPVEKRLPDNPWVAPTLDGPGKHGGLMRRAYTGTSDRYGPTKLIDKGLVWFDKKLVNQPRMAESWQTSTDAKEWTFKLRKGLKWSDGHDFTTADIKWFYDNWLMNKTLTPAPSGAVWTTGAPPNVKVAQLTVVDPQTFKLTYDVPNPLLLLRLGRYSPVSQGLAAPGHYLAQFHNDLTTDKDGLAAKVKTAGFPSWDRYFLDDRSWWYANPDLPSIGAWVAQAPIGKDLFLMVRNPYFFGVDSTGQQLPYFDQINHRLYQDANTFKLWITSGDIDFQARNVSSAAADYTLFRQSETKGDYKVVKGISATHIGLQPNQGAKNQKLRDFFSDRNVRIAMNLSINRDEINELVFAGLCTPRQYSPISVSPQYYKKAAEAYVKYDVATANKMLDDAGYKKGADGFRTLKDGSSLSFTIEGIDNVGTPNEDATQRVVKFFNAIGLKCSYKYTERSLYTTHYTANDVEMSNWGGDRTVLPLAPEAIIFRGVQPDRPWAGGYGLWFLNNQDPNGIKPPDGHFITKIWDIWSKISVEPDPDKENQLFNQILDIWAEEVPSIGVLGETPSFAIVKNGIKNFAAGFPNDDTTGDEEVYNAETYYWDDPTKHPVA